MNNKSKAFAAFINKYKVYLFSGMCIVFIPTIFSLSYSEWLYYNVYLRPLYAIFSFSPIKSYWVHTFTITLVSIFIFTIAVCFLLPDDNNKKKVNWVSCIFQLLAVIIIVGLGYLFLRSTITNAIAVYNDRYEVLDSNITNIKKSVRRGGRGSRSNVYQIDCTPVDKTISKKIYSKEKHIDLDAYQYINLNKIKEEYLALNIPLYRVKLKAYYLPNSRTVVKYECYVEE